LSDPLQIAIIGGGIGGLAAALALRARGQDVTVYEKAPTFSEIGAGIGMAPNALRLLDRIDIGERVREIGCPGGIASVRDWRGQVLRAGDWLHESSDDGPAYSVHRAELMNVLADALPDEVLRLNHRCVFAEESTDGVRIVFADGARADADVVIGADGMHSVVQSAVGVASSPASEHVMAYRGLVPMARLSWVDADHHGAMWVGPMRSFLCYPVSAGRSMNVVAFVPTDHDAVESWSAPGDVASLAAEFVGWDGPVGETIDAMDETFRWGIYDRPSLPRWSTNRITLLGDAAHAMVPHLGQGANQSIEDGFALAVLLEGVVHEEVPERLRTYEKLRRDRTSRVQIAARRAGQVYRAVDESAEDRARQLAGVSDGSWLADYDAEGEATKALAHVS
jgi:salicylate hydroxylase